MIIKVGDIFISNQGCKAEVIEYISCFRVKIQFQDKYKYQYFVRADKLKSGSVKNPYFPSACSIGYLGSGRHKASVNLVPTKPYRTWHGMLSRCYSEKTQSKHPTYKDCSVHPDWHNFQTFAEWFEENYIEGYDLDKDKLVKSNRIYSADTCCFISQQENIEVSSAKLHKFISPKGETVEIFNLKKFARQNNLHQGAMCDTHNGKISQHKGWRAAK